MLVPDNTNQSCAQNPSMVPQFPWSISQVFTVAHRSYTNYPPIPPIPFWIHHLRLLPIKKLGLRRIKHWTHFHSKGNPSSRWRSSSQLFKAWLSWAVQNLHCPITKLLLVLLSLSRLHAHPSSFLGTVYVKT